MGMQSSRMIYRGKDHKDIYFQGKYHDAMYLGYELLWHKIRQEGYYIIVLPNGKEEKSEKGVYVISFDEKTGEFEIIMDVKDYPGIYVENFFGVMYAVDSKTLYMSNIAEGDSVYASTDGIYFEKTNITLENQEDILPFFVSSYHSYSIKENDGFNKKVDYMWGAAGRLGINHFFIRKSIITKKDGNYSIESNEIDTSLKNYTEFPNEDRHFGMYIPNYGDSRFALHEEIYTYKYDVVIGKPDSIKDRYTKTKIKYYDTEEEKSGEIAEFEVKSFQYNGENPISRFMGVSNFSSVNGVYVFFVTEYYETFKIEKEQKLYAYYSYDGFTYKNSIIYDKKASFGMEEKIDFPRVLLVLHRKGMYYLYAGGEIDEYYEPPYTLFLTTDFKHFQKKKIPREIKIGKEKINTLKLIKAEGGTTNKKKRYFYKGNVSEPEDGILTIYEENIVYIDNMFFRESKGNKILNIKEV